MADDSKLQGVQHDEDAASLAKAPVIAQTEMRGSRMAAAILAENPRPFRKSFLKLYLCIFVGYLCSATSGFDANTFGGLSAIPSFVDYFGITTENQGLVAALYVIGNIAGALFAGPCADTYGRRFGMALGSAICIIGAILQAAGQSLSMLMAGRFILGVGAVLVQSCGPAYVVEMAYPKYRGQLTGGFQACFFLGTIISTWLEYGLYFLNTSQSFIWRVPLAVQGLPSIIILAAIWFIPETPRWYVGNDQVDKAREILVKYHGDGREDSVVAALELEEMLEVISLEGSNKRWWDFRELFDSRAARYRTFLVTCIAWFGQLDLPPTSYYFPLMAKTAGITSTQTQLLLNALQTPIMMCAALCGLYFIGLFDRRPLLMFSSAGMSASVAIITACTAHQAGHPATGGAGVAFIYVFLVVFAFAWTPMQSLYPSEVLTFSTRGKGLAYLNFMVNVVNVFNTYTPPIGITRSGFWFYLLYAIWDAFGVVVIYFTFVETRGRSLEELEELFHAKSPVKQSLKKKRMSVIADGTVREGDPAAL